MNIFLTVIQVIILAVSGVLLWQIWHFLKRKDIPDDEPLGEERAKYLTDRLKILSVCIAAEAVLTIARCILRMVETL